MDYSNPVCFPLSFLDRPQAHMVIFPRIAPGSDMSAARENLFFYSSWGILSNAGLEFDIAVVLIICRDDRRVCCDFLLKTTRRRASVSLQSLFQ